MEVERVEHDPESTWQINHAKKLRAHRVCEALQRWNCHLYHSARCLFCLSPSIGRVCLSDSLVFGTRLVILLCALFSS